MQLEFDPIVSRNQVFAIEKIIMEETSSPEKREKKREIVRWLKNAPLLIRKKKKKKKKTVLGMKNCLKSGKCNGCGKINVTVSYSSPYSSAVFASPDSGETVFQLTRAGSSASIANSLIQMGKKIEAR